MTSPNERTATLCGLGAILLWSSAAGLIRSVAEALGPVGGAATIYTIGTVLLLMMFGRPRLRALPRPYLIAGSALFVAYEICFSLSLGFAKDRAQAIEVGIVNYLWPCLTVVLAIAMNGQRATWAIVPGTLLALFGIFRVVSGEGFALDSTLDHLASNPVSYGLAATGALLWALYCNVTRRFADGKNAVTLFFALTALALWLKYAMSHEPVLALNSGNLLQAIATGSAMALGYGLWNVGILRGNMTLLATASYFTPALSSAFAAFWLGIHLTLPFWQGTLMVTGGSLLCWWATRQPRKGSAQSG
ncbi:aromatic amino acid DMT transporter YddG [Pseudomonas mangiferae]|uniref:Drug/metabolite DMT transporter permease n=1 Tax=Pseudomonas mangiferae TaxID=2593654 RepID=A0A553GV47_9PSED|nr:aromatic amino acid DMT transporter YddG [Pseudomonas mangiferae]TRX73374.1 drug/metabolite DMT transporter permease [Pseudomonas mangiferae]